jgi:Xaa-Pro aminopeptidase
MTSTFDFAVGIDGRKVRRSEFNQVSAQERDRRWACIRQKMSDYGVDCLLLNGNSGRWNEMNANMRYVTGYADPLSGTCYALFPATGAGTLVTQMTGKRSLHTLSWFSDIRVGASVRLAEIVEERLTDLGLTRGTLGLAGICFRSRESIGLPWNLLEEIKRRLPNLQIKDVTEIFFELRTVKSEEELWCLEQSALIADKGFEAHLHSWRPGITEREYASEIVNAMNKTGAEPPTFLLLESGPLGTWLTQDPLPSNRVIEPGDYVVSELSPKYAGYQAQSLQCAVFGKPRPEMFELVKWGVEVWERITDKLRPGNTIEMAENSAGDIIDRCRAKMGEVWANALIPHCSFAGLGGPDPFPRPLEIQPNQAFMGEIGPYGGKGDPRPWWRMNGGYCLLSTEGAPRHLCGKYPIQDRLMAIVG